MATKFKPRKYQSPREVKGRAFGGGGAMAVSRTKRAKPKRFWRSSDEPFKMPSVGTLIKKGLKCLAVGVVSFVGLSALTVAIILVYMYVNESDYFMVQPQSIPVTGLSMLTREEVLEAAELQEPMNNLTLDTTKIINKLKATPWVEDAEISKTFPNGLSIKVREYKPKAIVSLQNLYFIDETGFPFKKLDPGEFSDLPLISGFTLDELSNGGPLVKDAFAEIFALVAVLNDRKDDYRTDNVSEFHYDPDRGITLFTKKTGLQIKVGLGGYSKKFWRLGRVTNHLKSEGLDEGLAYMNVEYPKRVTLSYRPGAAASAAAAKRAAAQGESG
ncbi:MAG: FtsQ-type POTRA domain-containing protein [Deltaproteobacteria bacterium]|nr:FtsQ-type POTRA domain-containing protein [Deltaproteobacteria bacterium]